MVRPFPATADDETCVADDELSGCNDDDEEDLRKVKTKSLKKWKSADDIIRSGSIVDRSMILAKRRRLRMRDRTSKPLVFSSTETDEGEAPKPAVRHKLLPADPKSNKHYVKNPNVGKRQSANPQLNHTDSGHDSDTLSPCSSPYRKVVIGSVLDRQASAPEQSSSSKRQTSVFKKPWENRLQNLQWVRKSRVNEDIQVGSRSSLV
ncbi:unnamed protein product [Lymnaea stagnalis]|uniref:Uncharacterized protein n=1 Tax=Lymnaea stagnalis TaxID=6523 RepID=A0AAV2IVR4_LYMST